MKNSILLLFAVILLLASCNLPENSPADQIESGALYTIAAQTVIAQYTADAAQVLNQVDSSPSLTPSEITASQVAEQPSETPTPTLTQTPTATLTLTKIPDAILEDDFSNTDIWYAAKEDQFGFEYTAGGYQIYNKILNAAIWSVRDFSYGDIVVEVDATRKSGPEDGYFGVVCHFSDEGWNYIALVISDNGKYGILRMLNNKLEFLETGIDENSVIQKGIGQTNRIRGECSGGKYVLSVNGSQLVELLDDSFTSGDIGMIAGNRLSGDGISVLFDNFVLLQP